MVSSDFHLLKVDNSVDNSTDNLKKNMKNY